MMGTSWEVKTHLTPSVITALSGAEHLGEVNSWSGSQRKQEKNRVKSSFSKRKEQEGQGPGLPPKLLPGQSISGCSRVGFFGNDSPWKGNSIQYLEPTVHCPEF